MIKLGKKLGLAALLAFGVISAANASLVTLDTFDYDTNIDIEHPGISTAERFDINPANGDVRYTITRTSGALGSAGAESFNVLDGDLKWSNPSGVESELVLYYSEFGGLPGTGFLDLTFGGSMSAFYFDVMQSDFGFAIEVVVGSLSGVSIWSSISEEIDSLTRQTASFDSFVDVGPGADFSAATFVQIKLSSNGVDAVDLHLVEFGTIPEPTTVAIFGLALVGLGLSRRKAK